MSLVGQLRESRAEVCALVQARGYAAEDVAREIDSLVAALERGAADGVGATVLRLVVGDGVFDWLERRAVEAAVRELRIVHQWVLAGVAAPIEALEASLRADVRTAERLAFILPNARIMVAEIDRELRFRWLYDPQQLPGGVEMIGQSVRDHANPVFAERVAEIVGRVIRTGVGERVELSPPQEGAPEHVLASFEPTRDPSGEIAGVLIAATDVTELKQTQIALAQSVAFREQMLAVLAHDLRNPLSSVLALARLYARDERVPANVQRALSQIDQASQRMVELIGTLLDFSAARFGEALPVTRVDGDLLEIARGAVEELRSTAPERTIVLAAEGDTRGAWDPARMAQVVSNLVGNALTYGAAREPVVVDVEGRPGRVLLRVSNRGPVIPPDAMPVLFEPFRRGGDPDTRPRGLGLGLYIVRQIVEAHAGAIRVESTTERGTVFTVDVPR
jgi:signal transduction histidine kinase